MLACFNVQCQLSSRQYFSFGWIVWMKKGALKIGISMSVVLALLGYDNVLRLTDGQLSQKSTGSQ